MEEGYNIEEDTLMEYYIGVTQEGIPFYLYEDIFDRYHYINEKYYLNIYITKQNYMEFHYPKKALIYFNSNSGTLFHVKKYNYSIFNNIDKISDLISNADYYQLCQGEDTPNELFFYNIENNKKSQIDFFSSVFGNFNTYFIKKNNIKKLSDLNFDKIDENNFY